MPAAARPRTLIVRRPSEHRSGARAALARVPGADLQQAALPRGAGHRHARRAPSRATASSRRPTSSGCASRSRCSATTILPLSRHPRVPRRRRRRPRSGPAVGGRPRSCPRRAATAATSCSPPPAPLRSCSTTRSAPACIVGDRRATPTSPSRSCAPSSRSTGTASSRATCARCARAPSATSRSSSRRSRRCCVGRMPRPAPGPASSRPSSPKRLDEVRAIFVRAALDDMLS